MSLDDSVSTEIDVDLENGKKAAQLLWQEAPEAESVSDPRNPSFAQGIILGLGAELAGTAGSVKKLMRGAAAAAEDLNVEPFQGLIEVIQNADDLRASEVRFALRDGENRELLIVHNGEVVSCHHVLGITLPFFTTKTERTDQRGRFGIGLKTLKRIATSLSIHSSPYHFSVDQLILNTVPIESAIPNFYDPSQDTLIILTLRPDFDEDALRRWYDNWEDDGLIFLTAVSSFRWCDLSGITRDGRELTFSQWQPAPIDEGNLELLELSTRDVVGAQRSWKAWRAKIAVPLELSPAHKKRSETTQISIAVPSDHSKGSLYIGFKTRNPISLSFSIDAQFDPSTAREGLLDNPWNTWLAKRCGDVIAAVAQSKFESEPLTAWSIVPLPSDFVGHENDTWLRGVFSEGFAVTREHLAQYTKLTLKSGLVKIDGVAYEDSELSSLLLEDDINTLAPDKKALSQEVRDESGRWREVLDALDVSTRIGTSDLLGGFSSRAFDKKPVKWWIEAGRVLVEHHPDDELFDAPFLIGGDLRARCCHARGQTTRPLVLDSAYSLFAERWELVDGLHPAYATGDSAEIVTSWLEQNAAFHFKSTPETELEAFAARFHESKLEISDDQLRELRDRFDNLSDAEAAVLGRKVGMALHLDGFTYKAGKLSKHKVSAADAYLCKTLDSDGASWPVAADNTPGIQWLAARYEDVLKTGATRFSRKRLDGTISRAARKFLMLLGAEVAPRLLQTVPRGWVNTTRAQDLRDARSQQVASDWESPDLAKVLTSLTKASKRDRKVRSPALVKAISKSWSRTYLARKTVTSQRVGRVYVYNQAKITAAWLIMLRETQWVAIGKGELVTPAEAVIRTTETQTLYDSSQFVADLDLETLDADFIETLKIITTVRVSDFVELLREIRDNGTDADESRVLQLYRSIARHVPKNASYSTSVGDLSAQELRSSFSHGRGLIYVGDGLWRAPDEVLRGKDIFHDKNRFAPGGALYANLWIVLSIQEPSLEDCLRFLRALGDETPDGATTSILIDVYRYMEPLLEDAERKHKDRLRNLPLLCVNGWTNQRPILLIDDQEVRTQIAKALPSKNFWTPPCDLRELPLLVSMTGVTRSAPKLVVVEDSEAAAEKAISTRAHFEQAVDYLSNELAQNDPHTREKIRIGWDSLKSIPLHIYSGPIAVDAIDENLTTSAVRIEIRALITAQPLGLHSWEDALSRREFGGHAIASLFPPAQSRHIEAEWVVAWQEGRDQVQEVIRLASDEEHTAAMDEQAGKISASLGKKVNLKKPTGKGPETKPRTLKEGAASLADVTLMSGKPPQPTPPPTKTQLHTTAPSSSTSSQLPSSAPTSYTIADLEQRGWELLVLALENSPEETLVDFRRRHSVGADGVIDWRKFVEMKATARQPQTSIEMSNSEYERAKERGNDFILALVSGLESGFQDQVRLIFDPAKRVAIRPLNGVRLVSLGDAPAVIVSFHHEDKTADLD